MAVSTRRRTAHPGAAAPNEKVMPPRGRVRRRLSAVRAAGVTPAACRRSTRSQHRPQLLQGAAHLRLDGAHRAVVQLGDLLVGQVAVLAEEKDLLLLGPQV